MTNSLKSLVASIAGFLSWELLALVFGNQPNISTVCQIIAHITRVGH
jgi:uncharacterized membrane protein YuzA (DUF378 family)